MKKKIIISINFILILFLALFVFFGLDHRLSTTCYEYSSEKIPKTFNGFSIVQISDLHLKNFGSHQSSLISAIEECRPDVIVMTGDIVDEDHSDLTPLSDLLEGIYQLAPVYFVSGNHDLMPEASSQYEQMQDLFREYGVIDLDDQNAFIQIGASKICFTGSKWRSKYVSDYLSDADQDYFNILLYHGSDYFPSLASFGYDLILSGHAHGGIVRLPFIGGVFGNNGELFPEYDAGVFSLEQSTLISSRGLGDSHIPRFYNRPELVCIKLRSR